MYCHVADWPRICSDSRVEVRDASGALVDLADVEEPAEATVMCVDGSAYPHSVDDLARAAWAIIGIQPDSIVPLFSITGPVWSGMPQTSQAAEQTGAAVAPYYVRHRRSIHADMHSDCNAVVQAACKPHEDQLSHHRMYAGCRRFALLHSGADYRVKHVPAHRAWETILSLGPEARTAAVGNYHADLAAKAAVKAFHQQPAAASETALGNKICHARMVCKVVANVLPLFEAERFQRQPRLTKDEHALEGSSGSTEPASMAQVAEQHSWVEQAQGNGWYCKRCLQVWPKGQLEAHSARCPDAKYAGLFVGRCTGSSPPNRQHRPAEGGSRPMRRWLCGSTHRLHGLWSVCVLEASEPFAGVPRAPWRRHIWKKGARTAQGWEAPSQW